MKLEESLSKHRQHYVDFFRKTSDKRKGNKEVLLEMQNEEEIELFRLYRFDCLEKKGKDFATIDFENKNYLNHKQLEFDFGNMKVELNGFFWNACEFHFEDEINDLEQIIKWGEKWIHINMELDSIGVIHNIQRPIRQNNETIINIDFGTAPTNSFIELLKILEGMKIKKIKIDSSSRTKN